MPWSQCRKEQDNSLFSSFDGIAYRLIRVLLCPRQLSGSEICSLRRLICRIGECPSFQSDYPESLLATC